MPGFDTGSVMYALNVDFTGNSLTGGNPQVNTNGQLLIGATATPNIRVGTLTSPDNSITIGYSAPDITLVAAGGGGGGNYTLISTQTAANSAFVIFTGIPNTYNRFQLMFDFVQPISSGGQFFLQISTDNGATYESTNYTSGTNQFSIASGAWTSSQTTGGMLLTDAIASGNQDVQGTVFLHSFTSGVGFPGLEGMSSGNSGATFGSIILMGYYNIPGAVINAIRIGNSAGNIDTGIFSLYGISQ